MSLEQLKKETEERFNKLEICTLDKTIPLENMPQVIDFINAELERAYELGREEIKNKILNYKFTTIDAETALMDGNIKLSTISKKIVIDSKELIDLLTNKE